MVVDGVGWWATIDWDLYWDQFQPGFSVKALAGFQSFSRC